MNKFVYVCVALLAVMMTVDGICSMELRHKLYGSVRSHEKLHDLIGLNSNLDHTTLMVAAPSTIEQELAAQDQDFELVDRALNSRFMQWGAVGVMMMLVLYIIVYRDPRQAREREAAYAAREASEQACIKVLQKEYLDSLRERDTRYLESIGRFQSTVDKLSDRHHDGQEKVLVAITTLTEKLK